MRKADITALFNRSRSLLTLLPVIFPQIAEPHLRLLTDEAAPSRHQNAGMVYSSSTLELRLISRDHNNLVSFWEASYFDAPAFPPIFMYETWTGGGSPSKVSTHVVPNQSSSS